jgi:hypothetical protein
MAYTTIDDPSAYFTTTLYTGNGSSIDVTNSANSGNFAPDWLWIKERSSTSSHIIFDTNRPVSGGFAKHLHANETAAESGDSSELTAFGSNGFSYGSDGKGNQSSQTYVAWQWKANGGTTSSNGDGSITATVQANTTAGFSIITYTGNGTSGATIGHGLGKVPKWIVQKSRERTDYNWQVYHEAVSSDAETDFLRLNTNAAVADDATIWNDTAPSSSVITLGNSIGGNANGEGIVVYAFAEIQGYSKFGSYTGNGNADGTFVYTGFKPAWVMIKHSSGTSNWTINDVARDPTNVNNLRLFPNQNVAENSGSDSMDMLSNGFKFRSTDSGNNGSGATYVYMAFAEHPFVSSKGVPVTAR